MYVYSLDIPFSRVQQTAQFTPLVSELTLIRSHLLWGEFSAFSAANDISQCHFTFHNSPFFRSTRYPSLLGGQRRSGMRGFTQHLYTQVTTHYEHIFFAKLVTYIVTVCSAESNLNVEEDITSQVTSYLLNLQKG